MDSGNESDDEPVSTDILEDISDVIKSHTDVNRRDARYKIHDRIKQRHYEWKGALKSMQNMGKGSHKVFKTVVNKILQYLSPLDEAGSEVSHFIL